MYIGIDLGGTNIGVGIVDDNGKIIAKSSVPTNAKRGYSEIVKDMARLSKKLLKENNISESDIKGVGIGCPGTVDTKEGIVVFSNNIRMENVPLGEEFKKYFDVDVTILNDAEAAAFGEYKINGNGADSFIFITLGTGVGGGIVI
ncbi:MAG: ROK family protein, partial [Clostridia bacterium]|nr:ROK family protein [Clostridia bacterium]